MSHANAVLTPRTRLRLAQLVVDRGWTYAAAAKMFMVAPRTAKKWPTATGPRVSRACRTAAREPHSSPTRTGPEVVQRIVRLRWRQRLGPVQIAGRLGLATSTVHAVLVRCRNQPAPPPRPRHRRTAAPLRARPPRLADPRRRHQVRQHPRRRRPRFVAASTARPTPERRLTAPVNGATLPASDRHRLRPHRDRRPLADGLRRDLLRREGGHRHRCAPARGGLVRRARRHRRAVISDNGSAYRSYAWRQACADLGITPKRTRPYRPRPTARSRDSTAPCPTGGPTPGSTSQPSSATLPAKLAPLLQSPPAPTPPSEANHRSAG